MRQYYQKLKIFFSGLSDFFSRFFRFHWYRLLGLIDLVVFFGFRFVPPILKYPQLFVLDWHLLE